MKGIHIVPHIEKEASGPTYSVVRLCESLIKKGDFIILITLGSKNNKLDFHKAYQRLDFFYRLGVSPKMKKNIDKLVREKSIDYIHSHGLWEMPVIYASWIARKNNIPLIVSPRGALSEKAMKTGLKMVKVIFWTLFQKKALLSATCFHATSDSEYRDIRRMGFTQPVSIIPNGVDIQECKNIVKHTHKTLLFFGRIHPIKGIENLLHAWALVQSKFPDWRLEIAGPASKRYTNKIKLIANQLRIERIDFLGPLYGEHKWSAYKNADLYILPSFSENFGMTIAESLSIGTPVIASKGTPWGSLVRMNAGFWVENDVKSLEDCLREVLNMSVEELHKIGNNGFYWMRKEFSWDGVSKKMLETYQYILYNEEPLSDFIKL